MYLFDIFRQHALFLILLAIKYIYIYLNFLIYICRARDLLVWLSHAFDVNGHGDASANKSNSKSGEDEEIIHLSALVLPMISLWDDKIVKV